MDYKVMVKLIVPEIEKSFELYIPVNRTIREVCQLLNKMVNDETFGLFPIKSDLILCNRVNSEFYAYDSYVRDTSIRNGSQLVFF